LATARASSASSSRTCTAPKARPRTIASVLRPALHARFATGSAGRLRGCAAWPCVLVVDGWLRSSVLAWYLPFQRAAALLDGLIGGRIVRPRPSPPPRPGTVTGIKGRDRLAACRAPAREEVQTMKAQRLARALALAAVLAGTSVAPTGAVAAVTHSSHARHRPHRPTHRVTTVTFTARVVRSTSK